MAKFWRIIFLLFFLVAIVFAYVVGVKTQMAIVKATPVVKKQIPELAQQKLQNEQLISWAQNAATTALSFDYINLNKQLESAQQYFIPAGWKAFQNALQASGILATVTQKKLAASAIALKGPMILEQGIKSSIYQWKVQVPILVRYAGAQTVTQQNLLVTMEIQRTKKNVGKDGVGILSFGTEVVQ